MGAKDDIKEIELSCPHIDQAQELMEQLVELVGEEGLQIIKRISDELENTRAINRDLRGKCWEYAQHIELQELDKKELRERVADLQALVKDARHSLQSLHKFMGEYARA